MDLRYFEPIMKVTLTDAETCCYEGNTGVGVAAVVGSVVFVLTGRRVG